MNRCFESLLKLVSLAGFTIAQSPSVNALNALQTEQVTSIEVSRQTSRSIRHYLNENFDQTSETRASTINLWGSAAYTSLEFSGAGDVDLYQAVAGVDGRWDNFAFGGALSYARSESGGNKINLPTITPYVGYRFNQYLNTIAMAGYIRSEGSGDSEVFSNSGFTDIALNGILPIIDGLTLKPRAGYRFKYSGINLNRFFDFDLGFSDTSLDLYQNTLYGQAALEYKIGNLRAYFDSLYERVSTDTDLPNPVDDGANFVFITTGINYNLNKDLTLGLAYRHEINNDNLDYHQGMVNLALKF